MHDLYLKNIVQIDLNKRRKQLFALPGFQASDKIRQQLLEMKRLCGQRGNYRLKKQL